MNDGIYLLLGSNQGDRAANLAEAERRIVREAGSVVTRSSVYRTAAWGVEDQPEFYNQVLEIRSPHSPEQLLDILLGIERSMGRRRLKKWGPRIIDIDILFYGDEIVGKPALTLPHPGIPTRRFTLVPLAEIAPQFIHPVLKKTIAMLLEKCADSLAVTRVNAGQPPTYQRAKGN